MELCITVHINVINMRCVLIVFIGLLGGMAACKSSHAPAGGGSSVSRSRDTAVVTDSAAYVKDIMANKAKYVHKELGVLLNDLAIPIKSYSSHFSDRVKCAGLMLSFDERDVTVRKSEKMPGAGTPAQLYVEWETPLSRADVEARLKRAAGSWGEAEQAYYSKFDIKDIR